MEKTIRQVEFTAPRAINAVRVAAYTRVSSGKDAMLHSLSAQVSYYSNLIQKHPGWLYCGVYADEALTGTKDSRDEFQRLLVACRQHEIDLVITKSISRFARNTVTLLESVRELKALGVDVFFEEQNIHTMSADGELMLTILASYAQEESRSASENAKWRIRKGFENGELINLRFLFGYQIVNGEVSIDPATAPIVREIFLRAIAGESLNAIATDLNDRKILRPFDGTWNSMRIRELLSNEKYTGNALLQKSYRNNHLEKKKTANDGLLPKYYAAGTHEAIIGEDTFALAQERLKEIERSSSSKPRMLSAFTGKIVCAKCGRHYQRTRNKRYFVWNCLTFVKNGKSACGGGQIRESVLLQVSAEVLGLNTFDEQVFLDRISHIRFEENHRLIFVFKNGNEVEKQWEHPSRAASWTPEMKQAARERELNRRNTI